MSELYWLTDEQMARLEPYFPKSHGKPRVDDRRVLSGIVFVNRNGLRWPSRVWPTQDALQLMEAVGRKWRVPAHDGRAGRRERHAQDDNDRRDLPENTPHGIDPGD